MMGFPSHGRISCNRCFENKTSICARGKWRVVNDPGAWGSKNPRILVLGFSKGATQADAYQHKPFDRVAFAGSRHRLAQLLEHLGLMPNAKEIDGLMTEQEQDFAFGSLVRCSLSHWDASKETYLTSGPLIKRSFIDRDSVPVVRNCVERFLTDLPPRLRLVIMLGNDSGYVKLCMAEIACIRPGGLRGINDISYSDGKVTFIHVTHPSPGNGHFSNWLHGSPETTSGRKRELALAALRNVAFQS